MKGDNMKKKSIRKNAFSYIFLGIVILGVIYFVNVLNKKVNKLSYTEFKEAMINEKIETVTITPNSN